MARHRAPTIVAIDGPAGSGKSTVSKAAALRLGYGFLDTGAAYRALAWMLLERGVDTSDTGAVLAELDSFDYFIGTDPEGYHVLVGGTDVTGIIREPRVTVAVAPIARIPDVREHLNVLFRKIARNVDRPGIVIEGRDITTVVAPDAEVRILLTASEEARMGRRSRDRADSLVVDFMTAADGVTTVDSTHLDFEQTVDAVIEVITTSTMNTARNSHD
jgi:cytidylate kinase